MEKIKNIIFDLGVVLIDLDVGRSEKAFRQFLDGQYEHAYKWLTENEVFLNFEKGIISGESFINALQRAVTPVPDPKLIINAWNALLVGIPKRRLTLLRKLKQQYRLFLLSNTNTIHLTWIRNHVKREHRVDDFDAYFFEKTYYSFELGMRKPEEDIFDFVLEDAGILASETLFIDDKRENVEAARKMGIQAMLLPDGVDVTALVSRLD